MRGTPWTEDEDVKLRRWVAQGITTETMADMLGRSELSVTSRLYYLDVVKERSFARRAREGSTGLREAMLDAFVRFANRTGIGINDAQAILMGDRFTKPIPGTERIYKTASAQRLAA